MDHLQCFLGARGRRVVLLVALLALSLPASRAAARVDPAPERRSPSTHQAAPFAPTLTPSLSGSAVEGIILTADSLMASFQPLADYHTRTGHPTVVRGLSTIRAEDPRSNDLAQSIRSFLTRARTLWGTEWVLLGGDHESIPLRTALVLFSEPEEIPSDAYYADLDGTWDGNGNGIYGEVADGLDMEPDLAVGRMPVTNRAETEAQVAKGLRYRRAPPLAPPSKHLYLAEVLFPRDWTPGQQVQVDGSWQAESLRVRTPACVSIDRYYENHTKYAGSIPLTKAAALAALSRGYGVVQHIGHGSRSQISVGSELLTLGDLTTLSSGDSAALWISQNCASAAVDFDCFAEGLLRKTAGGAIAYVGATRDAWPGVSEVVAETVTDVAVPKAGKGRSLGEAVNAARRAILPAATGETPQRWGYFETILLGDPQMKVWRCTPSTLQVTRPATIALGAGGFAVHVESGGAPVESALVVAIKADEDYRSVVTDAAGNAWVPFLPSSTGPFSFTVSSDNAVTVEDSLAVTAAPAAHFGFLSLEDDDTIFGDGDGRVDAGEKFGFSGTLMNSGTGASGNPVTVEVAALSGGLVVEQASATLPAIGAGASVPFPVSLRILAAAAPNLTRAEQVRLIARDASRADTIVVGVEVAAAQLILATSTLADNAPGDGDGLPEPGETASWTFTLANAGDGTARGVILSAGTAAPGVALHDSTALVGDVLPGGTKTGAPAIRFSLSAPVTGRLFDVVVTDTRGHTVTWPVSRAALPAAPTGLRVDGSSSNRISLAWNAVASPPAGLLGYHVYRALDDGSPLVRVTAAPVRAIPEYEDAGLALLTRYRYAVSAVDSSGNEGALAPFIVASTTPPAATGWPAEMGQPTSSNICLGDLNGDGRPELLVGAEYLYVFRSDGTEWRDGDANPVTTGIFTTLLHNIPSSPAVADVDLDGTPEIIAASWNDSTLAVFRLDGTLLPGWPKKGAAPFWSSPAVGDIDNDGGLEVVVGSNSARLYAWNADGTEVRDGDANPTTDGVLFLPVGTVISSPAIADLDGDNVKEIVFGTSGSRVYAMHHDGLLPGWPFTGVGAFSGSPAVGDIVAGGGKEIAIGTTSDSVYVLTSAGTRAPGWPQPLEMTTGNGRATSAALGRLKAHLGDPSLHVIVAGADGALRAYDSTGGILPGFASLAIASATEASPAVADLEGDGSVEILIAGEDRRIHAFRHDGTSVSGFPIEIGAEARGTPAVWDLDGDGATEIAFAGWDRRLHVWDYPGTFSPLGAAWPMWRHDNWHTGVETFPILTHAEPTPMPAPDPAPTPARPWVAQNRPNPFNPSTRIRFGVPGPGAADVSLRVFDIAGRRVATLVSRKLDPGYHEVRWDGRTDRGVALGSGVFFLRAEIGPAHFTRKLVLVR
jgi:hypothetical protein